MRQTDPRTDPYDIDPAVESRPAVYANPPEAAPPRPARQHLVDGNTEPAATGKPARAPRRDSIDVTIDTMNEMPAYRLRETAGRMVSGVNPEQMKIFVDELNALGASDDVTGLVSVPAE